MSEIVDACIVDKTNSVLAVVDNYSKYHSGCGESFHVSQIKSELSLCFHFPDIYSGLCTCTIKRLDPDLL